MNKTLAADGGYILSGHTASYGVGKFGTWLIKTDATDTVVWNQTYVGREYEFGRWGAQTADGG